MQCHQLRRQEIDKVVSIDAILEIPLQEFPVLAVDLEHGRKTRFENEYFLSTSVIFLGCLLTLPILLACVVIWILVRFVPTAVT